ncbi:MAG: protein kinase [Nitrospirae bacterium]|nr:protein kinase [Nitrospirota bacterium]
MISITLDIYKGIKKVKSIVLSEPVSFIIGRSSESHLQINCKDSLVSRKHCMLELQTGKCMLVDLTSRNGTFVNGKRISKYVLNNGDQIQIGSSIIKVALTEVAVRGVTCKEVTVKGITCKECGNDVTEEALILFNDKLAIDNYVCTSCVGKKIVFSESTSIIRKTREEINKGHKCSTCNKDMSNLVNRDGLAYEFEDSKYMCRDCAQKESSSANALLSNDEYTVLNEIGRGSMGIVYKVVQNLTGRVCAFKRLHSSAIEDVRLMRLFEREVSVQSKIINQNLVRLIENGVIGDTYSFVTEYLPGGNVSRLMAKAKKKYLPPSLACYITVQMLRGLSALHNNGFIHRDIKPSNVVLSAPAPNEYLVVKICDYGLAKSFKGNDDSLFSSITKTGCDIGGSIMFMSPDLIRNYKYAKPPVDVYATGVSLYFMLTGTYTVDISRPANVINDIFKSVKHQIDAVLKEPPVPILKRRPELPEILAAVVDKAVSKDPEKGFQSADSLRNELEKIITSQGSFPIKYA